MVIREIACGLEHTLILTSNLYINIIIDEG